jgi:predicted transcriptional regulator
VAETITFRADDDVRRALSVLTADGTSVSGAVRSAVVEAARTHAEQQLAAEAAGLAADPADRAEAAQVMRDMETLRAW